MVGMGRLGISWEIGCLKKKNLRRGRDKPHTPARDIDLVGKNGLSVAREGLDARDLCWVLVTGRLAVVGGDLPLLKFEPWSFSLQPSFIYH